jgi:hypothetical protein
MDTVLYGIQVFRRRAYIAHPNDARMPYGKDADKAVGNPQDGLVREAGFSAFC